MALVDHARQYLDAYQSTSRYSHSRSPIAPTSFPCSPCLFSLLHSSEAHAGRDCDRVRSTYAAWVRAGQTLAYFGEQTSSLEEVVRSKHGERWDDNWKVGRQGQGSCGIFVNGVGATCRAIR